MGKKRVLSEMMVGEAISSEDEDFLDNVVGDLYPRLHGAIRATLKEWNFKPGDIGKIVALLERDGETEFVKKLRKHAERYIPR
jgi:hypothetical protein